MSDAPKPQTDSVAPSPIFRVRSARAWLERVWLSIAERGRGFAPIPPANIDAGQRARLLAESLLSERGEASGAAVSRELLTVLRKLTPERRGTYYLFPPIFPSGRGPPHRSSPDYLEALARNRRRPGRCRRAAAPGIAAPDEHVARRHRRAGRPAQGPAGVLRDQPGAEAAGRRPAASVRLLVQPRLSGIAPDRLADPGRGAGKTDHLRSRA